jgi:hypothetical protein
MSFMMERDRRKGREESKKNVYILNSKKPKDPFSHFPTLRLAVSADPS